VGLCLRVVVSFLRLCCFSLIGSLGLVTTPLHSPTKQHSGSSGPTPITILHNTGRPGLQYDGLEKFSSPHLMKAEFATCYCRQRHLQALTIQVVTKMSAIIYHTTLRHVTLQGLVIAARTSDVTYISLRRGYWMQRLQIPRSRLFKPKDGGSTLIHNIGTVHQSTHSYVKRFGTYTELQIQFETNTILFICLFVIFHFWLFLTNKLTLVLEFIYCTCKSETYYCKNNRTKYMALYGTHCVSINTLSYRNYYSNECSWTLQPNGSVCVTCFSIPDILIKP
jgi:hypothetical protein